MRKVSRKIGFGTASALIALATAGTSGTAHAQDAQNASNEGGLGEIVVTAQRRPEKLQEIPLAVTAFTEATIKEFNLNDAMAVSKYVPSMISQHNAGLATANAYYLRGLGNTQSVATFDAPVGTYVDDVYVARQNANNYAFFDTERVEVLRGPQGTLFGRNTTGGAVALIMRKPKDTLGAKFELSVGSFERVTAKTSIDLPISSKVLTKWSAFYVKDDGYLKNIYTGEKLNGQRDYGFRSDIRLLLSDDLTIDMSGEYAKNTGTYYAVRSVAGRSAYSPTLTPIFYEAATALPKTDCSKGDPVAILRSTEAGMCLNSDNYAGTVNINYNTDAGSLQGIFGYREQYQSYINQYSTSANPSKYSPFTLADEIRNYQYSGELKWSSDLMDGKLKYVAGLYYLKETNLLRTAGFSGGTASYVMTNDNQIRQRVETAAAYLQADYELFPNLTATVGARYTWEVKKLETFLSSRTPGMGFSTAQFTAFGYPDRLTQSRVTPRFALSYKVDPNVIVFASATNGFKSGGWNGGSSAPAAILPFRPEVTWSYEGGFKSELFGRKLRLNGTFYFADTKDIQITSGTFLPGIATIQSVARNVGTLRAYGFEYETAFSFNKAFNMFINGSFNHYEYRNLPGPADGVAYLPSEVQPGMKPVRAPKMQVAIGGTYRVPVDALHGSFGLTGSYRHNSSYFAQLNNGTYTPGEDFVDLQLGFDDADGKYGVAFGVTNLTDQKTVTANFLGIYPGDPRRYTGRLWFNF
ncbi:MAG: TonB-dependent receptor [Sphingobium sp.]